LVSRKNIEPKERSLRVLKGGEKGNPNIHASYEKKKLREEKKNKDVKN